MLIVIIQVQVATCTYVLVQARAGWGLVSQNTEILNPGVFHRIEP